MSDWFSLSVLQILSVLSFVTSVLAVVRVGAGSFNRLQHKFEADVNQPASVMSIAASVKLPAWNWKVSGLPVSFSLGSILGEDEVEETEDGLGKFGGGSSVVRMDWQVSRPQIAPPPPQFSQPPLSMAKLIMTRHQLQRKASRSQRRMQSMSRPPTPFSPLSRSTI